MILYIVLAAVLLLVLGPALLADRSPIPETSGNVHKVSKSAELDTILSSNERVVVDFYADWCPPCRVIAPIFSKLADEHASQGRLAFAKINVDHVRDVAGRYGISAMPTFLFFNNGKLVSVPVPSLKQTANAGSQNESIEKVLGADASLLRKAVRALADQA